VSQPRFWWSPTRSQHRLSVWTFRRRLPTCTREDHRRVRCCCHSAGSLCRGRPQDLPRQRAARSWRDATRASVGRYVLLRGRESRPRWLIRPQDPLQLSRHVAVVKVRDRHPQSQQTMFITSWCNALRLARPRIRGGIRRRTTVQAESASLLGHARVTWADVSPPMSCRFPTSTSSGRAGHQGPGEAAGACRRCRADGGRSPSR